jgi:hypothetical protein
MTSPFPSLSRETLVAVVSATCAFALGACSNTVTSTAVQPLSKHGVSAQTISWTFHQVDDTGSNRSNYAVTGINDDEHIVGTYKAPPSPRPILPSPTAISEPRTARELPSRTRLPTTTTPTLWRAISRRSAQKLDRAQVSRPAGFASLGTLT